MKIEVNYSELNNLSVFLDEQFQSLDKDRNEVTQIINALSNSLLGNSYAVIFQRMSDFNDNQFAKLIMYTDMMAKDLKNCAKMYNMEEDEFESRMKSEEARYER